MADDEPGPTDEDRLRRLERRVDRLEDAVKALAERIDATDESSTPDEACGSPSSDRPPSEPTPIETQPERPDPAPTPTSTAESSTSLEERIGADLLAKAGVTVLVLGLAFFVAWAIETGLIGLTTRIVLGTLGGLAIAAIAYPFRDHERYARLARVFAGGGFGLTYFSLFAAHHFPEYQAVIGIGFWLDTILLTLVALGVAAYGLRLRSPAFLMEALGLGVTTAFLANEFTTFTLAYATMIGLGVAGAAARLRAPRVVALSLATIYGHGLFTYIAGEDPSVVLGALSVDAVLVAGFALLAPDEATPSVSSKASGSVSMYAANALGLVAVGTLVAETGGVLDEGVFTLLAGVAFGAASLPAFARSKSLGATSLLAGLAGLVLGSWIALELVNFVYASIAGYTLLSLLIPLVDHRLYDGTVHGIGVVLAWATLTVTPDLAAGLERTTVLGLAAIAYAIGFVEFKTTRSDEPTTQTTPAVPHLVAATLAVAALVVTELDAWGATVALGGAGIVPVLAGFAADWPEPRWAGLGLFGLALGKAFLVDVWELDPGLRVLAFVGLGVTLVAAAFAYARFLNDDPDDAN
jgi:uncharacterized membrane protein